METTLKLAIETYAKLANLSEIAVLKLIANNDEIVKRSVLTLMEGVI